MPNKQRRSILSGEPAQDDTPFCDFLAERSPVSEFYNLIKARVDAHRREAPRLLHVPEALQRQERRRAARADPHRALKPALAALQTPMRLIVRMFRTSNRHATIREAEQLAILRSADSADPAGVRGVDPVNTITTIATICLRRRAQARIFDPGMNPGASDIHIFFWVSEGQCTPQPVPAQVPESRTSFQPKFRKVERL